MALLFADRRAVGHRQSSPEAKMAAYRVNYTDGTNWLPESVMVSGGLANAMILASNKADQEMIRAPSTDWTRWTMHITDEVGETHRFPFPSKCSANRY
jgi:hypothetical protein